MNKVDKYSTKIYQYNIKGFTLIELLAVIAILSILVIVAVPNIMKMYNKAKESTFVTQAQNIYKAANNQTMTNEINGEMISRFYYAGNTSENPIDLKGNNKIYYDIEVENGKIIKLIISNEENSVNIENVNGVNVTDITAEEINKKDEEGYISVSEGTTYNPKIYGVSFNLTTGVYTRTNDAVGKTFINNANGTITSDFDNEEIYKEMIEETDSYGNKFIKIPKFYIKKIVNGDIWTYQISKKKQDSSYYLPACFVDEDTGLVYPYILVSKYNASLSTDTTKLESKTGKLPLVSKTIAQFRTLATANGAGYQLLDVHIIDVLQTLFYIEYATLDSTSIMYGFGAGQYDATHTISAINGATLTLATGKAAGYKVGQLIDIGTSLGGRQIATNLRITAVSGETITYEIIPGVSTSPGTIATTQIAYNVSYLTGLTDSVTTKSGSLIDNTSGKYPMKYRGMENLYANINQFVDGINIKDRVTYVAKNAKQYVSDVFASAYTQVGYTIANTNYYAKKMGYDANNPFIQLPIEVDTSANSKYKDYSFQNVGNRIAMIGGSWLNWTASGMSCWSLNNASPDSSLDLGARFIKTPS